MNKKLKGVIVVLLMMFLVGCGTNNDETNLNKETDEQNNTENQVEEFVPTKPLPEGVPVYPGAILTNEITSTGDSWQWLYQTTGSGKEIMTFFINSLIELGFNIDNYATVANHEEFFVVTEDQTIRIYWLDSDSIADVDNVTPDTPNRHYSIVVDLPKWENR